MPTNRSESGGHDWKEFQDQAVAAVRRSIHRELPSAVVIQVCSKTQLVVTGPHVTNQLHLDTSHLSELQAAAPGVLSSAELLPIFITHWLRGNLGPEFGDLFMAAATRGWRGMWLLDTARIGEFDGLFIVVTRALGILAVVAEVKHHNRPVTRSLLESFAHRVHRVGINKGYFVSGSGFHQGAIELAASAGVSLIDVHLGELVPGADLKPEMFYLLAPAETAESRAAFQRWYTERWPYFVFNLIRLGYGPEELGVDSDTFAKLVAIVQDADSKKHD
jgi:hypothetical protein